MEEGDGMIYAALMTAGILEFIFALLLTLEFFDMQAEKEAEYQEGYSDGYEDGTYDQLAYDRKRADQYYVGMDEYYDALVDEANCWFGMDGD